MAFYRFARHADDIADSPHLDAEDKLRHLEALGAGLRGQSVPGSSPGLALRATLAATSVGTEHAAELLEAFTRDAMGGQCWSWADLLAYCRFSAAPVGRFLLALHGEEERTYEAADALCAALQILNHVQDCGDDWRLLRRSYLPLSWFLGEGLTLETLQRNACCDGTRRVIDMTLDRVDDLIFSAQPLPGMIRSLRLRLEVSVILHLARALSAKLRRQDPLARKVRVGPFKTFFVFAVGMSRGLKAA